MEMQEMVAVLADVDGRLVEWRLELTGTPARKQVWATTPFDYRQPSLTGHHLDMLHALKSASATSALMRWNRGVFMVDHGRFTDHFSLTVDPAHAPEVFEAAVAVLKGEDGPALGFIREVDERVVETRFRV